MTKNDPLLRRYYRSIRKWLPCGQKQKKQIMEQIQSDVQVYCEQNPTADFAQMQATFGEPQTIAAAYVENMDTAQLLKSLRIRKRIVTIVTITVAAILLTWAAIVTWSAHTAHTEIHGTRIEVTIE